MEPPGRGLPSPLLDWLPSTAPGPKPMTRLSETAAALTCRQLRSSPCTSAKRDWSRFDFFCRLSLPCAAARLSQMSPALAVLASGEVAPASVS